MSCRQIHGSVNVELNCMREEILRLRKMASPDLAAENNILRAELAPWRQIRAEVASLPPWKSY